MMGKHDPILRDTFRIHDSQFSVLLFHHQLTWCPHKQGGEDMSEWISVKIRDIFSVELNQNENNGSSVTCCLPSQNNSSSPSQRLLVHYAQKTMCSEEWKKCELFLTHTKESVLNVWVTTIQSALDELKFRPRKFLFFVNPFGGKRKATSIFEKIVKPVLHVSNVQWTVITTQRQRHVTEHIASLSQEKLLEYDVAVAVGGDGTICEVITGLLMRNIETSSNKESNLKPAALLVAVIPAGSSNALAFSLNGTGDAETAAVHLVLGGSVPLDVGAIHNHTGVVRFIVTQMSYGHLADTLQESEKLRWMGPKRYDYAGFRKFLSHAAYEGSVDMKIVMDENRKIPTVCGGGEGCEDCNSEVKLLTGDNKVEQWKRVEGTFLGISGANISCRCVLSPNGMAPFAHISDGCLDLILIRKASRLNYLRYLLRIGGDSRTSFALPFVERYRVEEFIFTPIQCCSSTVEVNHGNSFPQGDEASSSMSLYVCGCDARQQKKNHSVWNCDGELLYQPSVRVTVHRNLVRVMSRKMSDVQVTFHMSSPDTS